MRVALCQFVSCLACLLWAAAASGQLRDDFESPEPAWKLAESDCAAQVIVQQRVFQHAHRGHGCEYIQLRAGQGSYTYLTYPTRPAPIIAELQPSIWVKANQPGIHLMLRVVLPRAIDPRMNQPFRTLLHGTFYDQPGSWQQLTLPNPLEELDRQVRLLRAQFPSARIDPREAYADLIVLNGYGGSGVTSLWLDDLEVPVHSLAVRRGDDPAVARSEAPYQQPLALSAPEPLRDHVRLEGSVLLARGRPLMVRMIDYQGEPLAWLKSLGFNTLRVYQLPSATLLEQAAQLDLWVVAPPPQLYGRQEIGAVYDAVLGWDLGAVRDAEDLQDKRQLAYAVRTSDPHPGRPVLVQSETFVRACSEMADVLLLQPPCGVDGTAGQIDVIAWLQQRASAVRLGTPVWISIPSQPPPALLEQWSLVAGGLDPSSGLANLDPDDLRLLAFRAVAAGARGVQFRSQSPLHGDDAATQLRARTLQLLNSELSTIEAWVAGGNYVEQLKDHQAGVRIDVLQTQRSRLLLATQSWTEATEGSFSEQRPLAFTLYGVPATDQAFLIAGGALEQLSQQRATGLRIHLQDPGVVDLVVVTQDPLVRTYLTRQLRATQRDEARLRYEIATRWLEFTKSVQQQLAGKASEPLSAREHLQQAEGNLRQCARLMATGDYPQSEVFVRRVMRLLAGVRQAYYDQVTATLVSPISSPWCATYQTLPLHYLLVQRLSAARWSANALAAGDMENLEHLFSSGWQQQLPDGSQWSGQVGLTFNDIHAGRAALRLQCTAADPRESSELAEPTTSLTSAAVAVEPGQLWRVEGWVKVDGDSGSDLVVSDSWLGDELALHITPGRWQPFALYRIAPDRGDLRVSFTLTGAGTALIDDVRMTVLSEPVAAPSTARAPAAVR